MLDWLRLQCKVPAWPITTPHVFLGDPLVKIVGNGGSCGLIYDAKDVQTTCGTGLFGGSVLGAVEVGRDSNNGVGDGATKVRLSNLFYPVQDCGCDFLGRLRMELGPQGSLVEK